MSEFSDRPFVAGSITGIRSFTVDSLGRLRGVTHADIWKPGENVAKCNIPTESLLGRLGARYYNAFYFGVDPTTAPNAPMLEPKKEEPKHQVAEQSCQCGYYAYLDEGANPYHISDEGNVLGVVEGYGVVTVGSRGFRAEKARIKALIVPKAKQQNWLLHARDSLAWKLKQVSDSPLFAVIGMFLIAGAITTFVTLASTFTPWWLFGLSLLAPGAVLTDASFRGICVDEKPVRDDDDLLFKVMQRNYPDVPIFRSQAAALQQFPLTPPEPVTPESVPDFWTRSA